MSKKILFVLFFILPPSIGIAGDAAGTTPLPPFIKGDFPDPAAEWNELWEHLFLDIAVLGIIFALVTFYFLFRYRRIRPDEVGRGKRLSALAAFGWVLIPGLIFLADDLHLAAKNFNLWQIYRNVPKDAYVVNVEAYMWGWDISHPDGIIETNVLHVQVGRPVKVELTSRDVVHSFFIPDFRVKWDTHPGRTTYLWFNPKEVGEHVFTCAEYCGALHSGMHGRVIVMPEDEFNQWVKENKKGGAV